MTIAGLETHFADVYKPTVAFGTQGDTRRTWPALASPSTADMGLCMEELTPGRAQRDFGVKTEIQFKAVVIADFPVAREDLARIKSGDFAVGENLLVVDEKRDSRCETKLIFLKRTNDKGPQ